MDESNLFALLVDLHRDGDRQGPGSEKETLRALELIRLDTSAPLQVADIGCGSGASTLILASQLPHAQITAVDLFPEFLDILNQQAQGKGYSDRVQTISESMDALSLPHGSLDLIWSEGAIYNMGFAEGIKAWRPLLRQGGVIAVSEITWLKPNPPEEIRDHWEREYPEIATASEKVVTLDREGYDLLGYFVLPPHTWIDKYYQPTAERIPAFLERHHKSPEAEAVVKSDRDEAALYERFQDWFSYGFYIAKKR